MRHYEKVPHELAEATNLSIGARALYPILRRLAWDAGRREANDAVPLPALTDIAATLGVADSTCRGYLSELRKTGWVETRRASRRRPSLWVIRDAPSAPDSGALGGSESAGKRRPSPPDSGDSSISLDATDGETTSLPVEGPPPIVKVGGRNLPLDALADVCGISPRSPRFIQCVTALNGRIHKTTGEVLAVGITHLYWDEISAWAVEHDQTDRLAALDAEHYSESLARSIRQKAERFRARMPGAEMSPSALRDWWLDLERTPAGAGQRRGGMTPDEIRNLGREDT